MRVRGVDESSVVATEELGGEFGTVTIRTIHERMLRETRQASTSDLAPDALLRVRTAEGIDLYGRADEILRDDGGEGDLSRAVRVAGGDDLVGLAVDLVELSPLPGLVAELTITAAVAWLEERLAGRFGLWRLPDSDDALAHPDSWARDVVGSRGDAPELLMLHGAFSLPSESFGALAETTAWRAIRSRYRGRILAHAGRTITASPIASALEVVRGLPRGTNLDVMSFSRGGLVGELLAEAPEALDPGRLARLRLGGDGADATVFEAMNGELSELREAILDRQVTVRRHLRVAAPLLGTPLVGSRLDRWLSFGLHALSLVPALAASPVFGFFKRTAFEIIRRKGDATRLPGLAAMDPTSPLVQALALRGPSRAETVAVAGDTDGAGVIHRLAVAAADLFFGEPNDLVVPTGSMWSSDARKTHGALTETAEVRASVRGTDVHHLAYFGHDAVRRVVADWAEGERGTRDERRARSATATEARGATVRPRPQVVILPGILGTTLQWRRGDEERTVWPDLCALLRGDLSRLELGATDGEIVPGAPLEVIYGALAHELREDLDVHAFGYDWRRSIDEISTELAKRIRTELSPSTNPVHMIGHSMGGAVAQYMLAHDTELAETLRSHDSALILLGTPTLGAAEALRVLLGDSRFVDLLAFASNPLDLRGARAEVLRLIRGFPGLVQLCAEQLVGDPARWRSLVTALDLSPQVLASAEAYWKWRRAMLASAAPPVRTHHVLGRARSTAEFVDVVGGRVDVRFSPRGDGSVLWSSAAPGERAGRWWIRSRHTELPLRIEAAAVRALLDPMRESTAPLARGEPEEMGLFDLRDETGDAQVRASPMRLPAVEDLLRAFAGEVPHERVALGAPVASRTPLRVEVAHGSVHASAGIVLLGVFEGEPPGELALQLDLAHDNAFVELWDKHAWPVEAGTWALVGPAKSPIALLVNIGRNGELTRLGLVDRFTRALRAYALGQRGAPAPENKAPRIQINAALVGCDGSNALGPEEGAAAIIESVVLANRVTGGAFGRLTLVEPYRDLAARITVAVADLTSWSLIRCSGDELELPRTYRSTEGYLGNRPPSVGRWETWSRLALTSTEEGETLVVTLRAGERSAARLRSSVRISRGTRAELAALATAAADDPATIARLFGALSTRALRSAIGGGEGLLLELDDKAAALPWELVLRNQSDEDHEPLEGVVRVLDEAAGCARLRVAMRRAALIVGDPHPRGVAALPGARAEAAAVRSAFAQGPGGRWLLAGADGATERQVLAWIGNDHYRFLHIATHGRITPDGRTEIHLGDGYWEGSALLDRMVEIPQMVFINACHAGARMEEASGFAASLARSFLRMGVRAAVVTGWAVSDRAAQTFAEAFYREVLDGESFGRAVRTARQETRRRHPGVNTWGAYQCYGEPSLVLVPEARLDRRLRPQRPNAAPDIPGPDEAIDAIHSLQGDARISAAGRRQEVVEAVRRLARRIPARARYSGDVSRRLGMLWLELGEVDAAAECFEEALRRPGHAQSSLFEWAADTFSRQGARAESAAAADARFGEADRILNALRALTPSRSSLYGVIAHHRLRMGDWDAALDALTQAATLDRSDHRFAVDRYLLTRALRPSQASIDDRTRRGPEPGWVGRDTFARRFVPDSLLVRWLHERSADQPLVAADAERVDEIAGCYCKTLALHTSTLWCDIVVDFLGCVLRARDSHAEGPIDEALRHGLTRIIEALADASRAPPPDHGGGAPTSEGARRVLARHVAPGDAETIARVLGAVPTEVTDAFTDVTVSRAQLRALHAAGILVDEYLPPAPAEAVSRETFRGADDGASRVWVVTRSTGIAPESLVARAGELGVEIVSQGDKNLRVRGVEAQILKLQESGLISDFSVWVEPTLNCVHARDLIGVRAMEAALAGAARAGAPAWLDARDQVVSVADSGCATHEQLPAEAIKARRDLTGLGDIDEVGHGTHVAGIIASRGVGSGVFLRGIAPGAKLFIQKIAGRQQGRVTMLGLPADYSALLDEASTAGARIHNWSWGALAEGDYTIEAREIDTWLRAHPEDLLVVAAGNAGTTVRKDDEPSGRQGFPRWRTLKSPGSAKNALVVGASRSSRSSGGFAAATYGDKFASDFPDPPSSLARISGDPEEVAAFSGRGPSIQGQVRPDLVAPGTDILSLLSRDVARPEDFFWGVTPNIGGAFLGGTSMATPIVAGAAAIVRQYLQTVRCIKCPSAALIKAVLIAGARWLTGASSVEDRAKRPNVHQGFGRVSLDGALPIDDSFSLTLWDTRNGAADPLAKRGDRRELLAAVREPRSPGEAARTLRVCLAYDDAPGNGIQNDLQLIVIHRGSRYLGNAGLTSADFARATGSFDRKNNVKVVEIANPGAGAVQIQVCADSLPYPPQHFALAVNGPLTQE